MALEASDADAETPKDSVGDIPVGPCKTGDSHPGGTCQTCAPDGSWMTCPFGCSSGACNAVVKLVAGERHNCVLTDVGTVWCWGGSDKGQTGLPAYDKEDETLPIPFPLPAPVDGLISGGNHLCAWVIWGAAWCWGYDDEGQVGSPTAGLDFPEPVLAFDADVRLIAEASDATSYAFVGSTERWVWGQLFASDATCQQGWCYEPTLTAAPAALPDVSVIATGLSSACAIDKQQKLWCWGAGTKCQLAKGNCDDEAEPTGPRFPAVSWTEVSVGHDAVCAIEADAGDLYCWGDNVQGAAGADPSQALVQSPKVLAAASPAKDVSVGLNHACAVTTVGGVACWGRTDFGATGSDGPDWEINHVPHMIEGLVDVEQVAVGRWHTCARGPGAIVHCWGSNSRQQLGAPGLTPDDYDTPQLVVANPQ